MQKKKWHWKLSKRQLILFSTFIVPLLIMMSYFAYRKMAPFGNSSVMTVDMGQQYIDFFAYMRHAILHDPSSIFYSFGNALGGEMLGTWAYYLLSPLNWILLFFPGTSLTSGIFIITILKYGLAGLSFAWMLERVTEQKGFKLILFASVYALMGWSVANQFNLMWLDVLYLLPLVFYGLHQLITVGKWRSYVIWLTLTLIINYYMAYMACLFTVLAFLWIVSDNFKNWKEVLVQLKRFVFSSIASGLLSAFVLLPTWWSLSQSKAQYTVTKFDWKFDFFVPKMIAKFFVGSFNFGQMPNGTANLFIGSFALVGCLFFFFDKRVTVHSRITAGIITAILFLSLCFQPLDLLWHAGQFPVWYPYRFSFVVSFWMILLAARTLTADFEPSWQAIVATAAIIIVGISYVFVQLKDFKFLQTNQILIGSIFVLVAMILVVLPVKKYWWYALLLCVVGVSEATTNVFLSLNNISYVSQKQYGNYTDELQNLVNQTQKNDDGFYRVGKNFLRTKGDPLQTGYNGGGVFSSVLNKSTPSFYGHIGSPDGGGFVEYSNGTLITDALLGMKYYFGRIPSDNAKVDYNILSSSANRADLAEYQTLEQDRYAIRYRNRNALPIGYAASSQILSLKDSSKVAATYQANWISALTGNETDKKMFPSVKFDNVSLKNLKKVGKLSNAKLIKKDPKKFAKITLSFTPKTSDAYYISFGPTITTDNADFVLNGNVITQYNIFRNPVLVSVANRAMNLPQKLVIIPKKKTLQLKNLALYRLDTVKFTTAIQKLSSEPWHLNKQNSRSFIGTITAGENQVLNTSIPYTKGWHAKVNGKNAKIHETIGMFIALKLDKGKNNVTLSYWPPLLNVGILISLITLSGLVGVQYSRKQAE